MTNDDIPMWAKKRACDETNALPNRVILMTPEDVGKEDRRALTAFAAYIAKHEPEPVDPLLVMAREAAARRQEEEGFAVYAANCRDGKEDDSDGVQSALIALRMAQEQGWEPRRD